MCRVELPTERGKQRPSGFICSIYRRTFASTSHIANIFISVSSAGKEASLDYAPLPV